MKTSGGIFVVGSMVMACCARVDSAPAAGESVRASAFQAEPGGKGFNVAVALRRLGLPVDGLFAIGDDAFGMLAARAFAAQGLSPSLLLTLPGGTGAGIGLIDRDGENRIAVYPGANDALDAGHAEAAAHRIAAARCVTAQFEVGDAAIDTAFALARAAGVATLLNPSPFRPIPAEMLGHTDMLVVNAGEARALAAVLGGDGHLGATPGEAGERALAKAVFDRGAAMLVVTHGGRGAMLYDRQGCHYQPAFPITPADTIGAGDAFLAALVAALAYGEGAAGALRWAAGAGAITAARCGVIDALPDLPTLRAFLAARA